MIRWIDRSRLARYIYISATPAPLHVCSANRTQMYMYQGAVSGEDVYIREGMAALAAGQLQGARWRRDEASPPGAGSLAAVPVPRRVGRRD